MAEQFPPPADAKEWTCPECGMDALYCPHTKIAQLESALAAATTAREAAEAWKPEERELARLFMQNRCGDAECEGARFAAAQNVIKGALTHREIADIVRDEMYRRSESTTPDVTLLAQRAEQAERERDEMRVQRNTVLTDIGTVMLRLEDAEQRAASLLTEGNGQPCAFCGELCHREPLSSRMTGLEPIGFFHADGTGILRWHHQKCVTALMERGASLAEGVAGLRRWAEKEYADHYDWAGQQRLLGFNPEAPACGRHDGRAKAMADVLAELDRLVPVAEKENQ